MKQKKPVSALRQVTWTALWRRKGVCILLSAIAALGVFSSILPLGRRLLWKRWCKPRRFIVW